MTQILLFDTETNGLPKSRNIAGNAEKGNWPDILSICWMIYEDEKHVKTEYHLVKPAGWKVKATAVHGLTQKMCETEGKPLAEVLGLFLADVAASKHVVAHNLRFDKNVVFSAAKWRLGVDPRASWTWGKDVCTACKGAVAGKIPKLDVLYESIFGKPAPEGAHNALRDVEVLKDVFFAKFWPELKAASATAATASATKGGTRRSKKNGRKTRKNYLSLGHIRF
jgi:DNA polymerase III epsilon subunit-like protein